MRYLFVAAVSYLAAGILSAEDASSDAKARREKAFSDGIALQRAIAAGEDATEFVGKEVMVRGMLVEPRKDPLLLKENGVSYLIRAPADQVSAVAHYVADTLYVLAHGTVTSIDSSGKRAGIQATFVGVIGAD